MVLMEIHLKRGNETKSSMDMKYWAEPEIGRLGMIRVVTPSDHDG